MTPSSSSGLRGWLARKLGAHLTRDEWLSAFRLGQASERQKREQATSALVWRERQSTPPPVQPPPPLKGARQVAEQRRQIAALKHTRHDVPKLDLDIERWMKRQGRA